MNQYLYRADSRPEIIYIIHYVNISCHVYIPIYHIPYTISIPYHIHNIYHILPIQLIRYYECGVPLTCCTTLLLRPLTLSDLTFPTNISCETLEFSRVVALRADKRFPCKSLKRQLNVHFGHKWLFCPEPKVILRDNCEPLWKSSVALRNRNQLTRSVDPTFQPISLSFGKKIISKVPHRVHYNNFRERHTRTSRHYEFFAHIREKRVGHRVISASEVNVLFLVRSPSMYLRKLACILYFVSPYPEHGVANSDGFLRENFGRWASSVFVGQHTSASPWLHRLQ